MFAQTNEPCLVIANNAGPASCHLCWSLETYDAPSPENPGPTLVSLPTVSSWSVTASPGLSFRQQLLTAKSRETTLEHQVKQLKAQMSKLKLKKAKDKKEKEDSGDKEEKEDGSREEKG